jgi:hypothetical protein
MARIRTIKPDFFTSEDIVSLSPCARLLYIALWCEADRAGRMQWRPRTFKMRYMPADDVDIESLCGEIQKAGLVILYGEGFAYIPSFAKHQHINPRESESSLPDPHASARVTDASSRVKALSLTHREEGKERKEVDTRQNAGSLHERFSRFWTAYPKKASKGTAEKAFAKIKPDDALLQNMLSALATASASEAWRKEGGQYIPNPATWLNAKGWEDEIHAPASGGSNPLFAGVI